MIFHEELVRPLEAIHNLDRLKRKNMRPDDSLEFGIFISPKKEDWSLNTHRKRKKNSSPSWRVLKTVSFSFSSSTFFPLSHRYRFFRFHPFEEKKIFEAFLFLLCCLSFSCDYFFPIFFKIRIFDLDFYDLKFHFFLVVLPHSITFSSTCVFIFA